MQIGFWNVNRNMDAVELMARASKPPDLLAFAECPPVAAVKERLDRCGYECRHLPGTNEKVCIFVRLGKLEIELKAAFERGVIFELCPKDNHRILIAAVHLYDQRTHSPDFLAPFTRPLRELVVREEKRAGHRRTLILGDFNLSPFDRGLNHPQLLLGAMDKRKARRLAAPRAKTRDAAFYNPMWSRLGDETPGPPGTYYRANGSHIDAFYYTFDQILVRPEALDYFGGLQIPTKLGGQLLTSDNDIPIQRISDHLPIIFDVSWSAE